MIAVPSAVSSRYEIRSPHFASRWGVTTRIIPGTRMSVIIAETGGEMKYSDLAYLLSMIFVAQALTPSLAAIIGALFFVLYGFLKWVGE